MRRGNMPSKEIHFHHIPGNTDLYPEEYGITKRDWLAGMAMQGIMASGAYSRYHNGGSSLDEEYQIRSYIVSDAYAIADGMIEEGRE
jgi:hypothetical protein